MSGNSYINYDVIKKDLNFSTAKNITLVIVAFYFGNYILNLNEKLNKLNEASDADRIKINNMSADLASLREQFDQSRVQLEDLSIVTGTNVDNITILAKNTKTRVNAVEKSIATVNENVAAVSGRVGIVEKKALSIEERTRAIEQAVDMPGANPLDSLITTYNQRP